MELEKPMGPATKYVGSSGWSGETMPPVPGRCKPLTRSLAEDSCAVWDKRAKTIVGLEICVLEAHDDVYDETSGTPTDPGEPSGENATDEVEAPEVTEELNRLETLGRAYKAPSVDEPMPLRFV